DRLADAPWRALGADRAERLAGLNGPLPRAALESGLRPAQSTRGIAAVPAPAPRPRTGRIRCAHASGVKDGIQACRARRPGRATDIVLRGGPGTITPPGRRGDGVVSCQLSLALARGEASDAEIWAWVAAGT